MDFRRQGFPANFSVQKIRNASASSIAIGRAVLAARVLTGSRGSGGVALLAFTTDWRLCVHAVLSRQLKQPDEFGDFFAIEMAQQLARHARDLVIHFA